VHTWSQREKRWASGHLDEGEKDFGVTIQAQVVRLWRDETGLEMDLKEAALGKGQRVRVQRYQPFLVHGAQWLDMQWVEKVKGAECYWWLREELGAV
jgi:hypothetical protein